jgi:hypothetical protein
MLLDLAGIGRIAQDFAEICRIWQDYAEFGRIAHNDM